MNKNPLAAGVALALLAGCGDQYVKRDEFNAALTELRGEQARQRSEIEALKADLQQRFSRYDAAITEMQNRVRVDMTAHFDVGSSQLREADKPALAEFARVVKERHPDVLVTVEGFTDPAGSVAYNKQLGQRRADAVRGYLVQAGLAADKVRAVGYGEAVSRQVVKNATGAEGLPNRRVALVVDFVPARAGNTGVSAAPAG